MKKTINLKYKHWLPWKSWSKQISLPAAGKFVCESHYVTNSDNIEPKSLGDGMNQHLLNSYKLLELNLPKEHIPQAIMDIYNESYKRVWTPAEGGGSIGANARDSKVDIWSEMWQGNMMFESSIELASARGKYLVTNPANDRHCIIQMGEEIGPPEEDNLGGLTPEVHWWLKSSNETRLIIGYCADQSLPLGPVLS